jgi:hypothetical protein
MEKKEARKQAAGVALVPETTEDEENSGVTPNK